MVIIHGLDQNKGKSSQPKVTKWGKPSISLLNEEGKNKKKKANVTI